MFTFAGRLLVIATMVVIGAIFYFVVMFVNDKVESGILPSGHYSIAFLLIPAVVVAGFFFGLSSFILELMGVQIWSKSDDHDH
jgi:hypothetical protein